MRLLIVGTMDGQIGAASKIAMDRGAKVSHVPNTETALSMLRSGRGADLLMLAAELDIAGFIGPYGENAFTHPSLHTVSAPTAKSLCAQSAPVRRNTSPCPRMPT